MIDHTKHRQANSTILNYIDQYLQVATQSAQDALTAANSAQAAANQASLDAASAVAAVQEADDIIELNTFGDFPAVGDPEKLYRALTGTEKDKLYRWDGTGYSVVGGAGLSGITAMTAVGAAPNPQGGSISGNQLTLQPADNLNPGVLTIVDQVLKGVKSFADNPKIPLGTLGAADAVIGQIADGTIGRISSSKLTSLLDTFTRTTPGTVPAPNGAVGANTKVLYEDGQWRDPSSGSGTALEIAATYAGITASASKRFILVNTDENNNNDASLYVHDGSAIRFLLTLPA
jgi:hypothetical protein